MPLPQSARISFVPSLPGTYRFYLRVSDGLSLSPPDLVDITIAGSLNQAPVAEAGLASLTYALEGPAPLPLDGSASTDPEGAPLTYRWEVLSAPELVVLSDSTAAQPTFTPASSREYRFCLTVSDGEHSASDETALVIRFSGRPRAQVSDPASPNPTFVAVEPGTYLFVLEVADADAQLDRDEIAIQVSAQVYLEQAGMIEIPAGPFAMGDDQGSAEDEAPEHQVNLSSFWLDKNEVTTGSYLACVDAGACAPAGQFANCNSSLTDRNDHPINCVDWTQANAYCEWAAKRLPTEAEWEKAARGADQRKYPWGDVNPTGALLNYDSNAGGTQPVGSYPSGASPYGLLDLSGNVLEWTADYYAADYYTTSPTQDPQGPPPSAEGDFRVVRSSSWNTGDARALTTTVRNNFPATTSDPALGFRCARTTAP